MLQILKKQKKKNRIKSLSDFGRRATDIKRARTCPSINTPVQPVTRLLFGHWSPKIMGSMFVLPTVANTWCMHGRRFPFFFLRLVGGEPMPVAENNGRCCIWANNMYIWKIKAFTREINGRPRGRWRFVLNFHAVSRVRRRIDYVCRYHIYFALLTGSFCRLTPALTIGSLKQQISDDKVREHGKNSAHISNILMCLFLYFPQQWKKKRKNI